MTAREIGSLVMAFGFMMLPVAARAQAALSGGIAGVVRDTTGAVLPGVTVEAASPALIEKVRAVVTDNQGQYKIVELRPGTYTVTFTLTGFSRVRREGVELATGFTAAVNAELSVGLLAETITVSGASPVVDVQNTQPQVVLQRAVLDALPTAKSFASYQALIPGVTGGGYPVQRDVGGTSGEAPLGQTVHGSDGGLTSLDGIMIISLRSPFNRTLSINHGYIDEVVVKMGSGSAETWSAGVHINIVPKSGGNTLQGNLFADYSGRGLDSNNLTDDLRARGLNSYNKQRSLYDVGGGIGGKIKQDRAWFFWSSRYWGNSSDVAGNYFNATPHTLFYTPDLNRPAIFGSKQWDNTGRVTWQATRKDKLVFQVNGGSRCWCPGDSLSGLYSPEGTWIFWYGPERLLQASWTRPASSRVLLEGGAAWRRDTNRTLATEGVLPTDRSVLETTINRRYGSNFQGALYQAQTVLDYYVAPSDQWMTRGALSFITGSHALKAGFSTLTGFVTTGAQPNFPENYIFRNQVPIALTLFASPHRLETNMNMTLGLYVQDQWTVRRLTVNAGLRFDYINASSPAQTRPGGEYLPPLSFPEVNDLPNWKDLQPRLGVAYDLFGNGKTALKLSGGRYALGNNFGLGFARLNSPAGRLVVSTDRTWTDANGNYVPDCDLKTPLASGECGPMANQNFGTSRGATLYADELKRGWGVSPYLWQIQAAMQHELLANVALNAGYYRTWQGNISLTDNLAVTTADFTPYCITAPANPRLPGGGGYPVCGLYDVSPSRFGQVQNLVTFAPDRTNVFDGFDANLTARFGSGGMLRAGFATGQTVIDNCATPDVPPQFCRRTVPFEAQTDIKVSAVYPLPWWQLQASAVYQNLPGVLRAASYVASNAEIAPSLGRNLAACPNATGACNATAVVDLVEPNTLFEPRGSQLDLRLSKIFQIGRGRVQGNIDVYNATNESDVLSLNNRYGPQWWNAIGILAGRVWKFSAQLDF